MKSYHILAIAVLIAGCAPAVANDCLNAVGDVNGDGVIAPHDAALTLDIALGGTASECELEAADWDGDGIVTEADAEGILAFYVK